MTFHAARGDFNSWASRESELEPDLAPFLGQLRGLPLDHAMRGDLSGRGPQVAGEKGLARKSKRRSWSLAPRFPREA